MYKNFSHNMIMKKNGFIKGAVILIVFNLIGKVVGAVYRIPLANLLGLQGMGEYQLIFPLYSFLLSVSTSGVPVAISKLVSEYNSQNRVQDSKRLLKSAILYLFAISLVCFFIVVFAAKFIAGIQGNLNIYICYYGIAPAILFVGLLSVFRGYFQGNLMMVPTALSGLVEQIGKLIFGLFFAGRLLPYGVTYGVLGAIIGISVSELLALVFIAGYYFISQRKIAKETQREVCSYRVLSRKLLSVALPITFGGLAYPIVSIIDSVLVVNLLMFTGFSSAEATSLFGLQFGIVDPILNIPIIIAVSVSASILPNISKAVALNGEKEVKDLTERAFQIILSITLACAVCFVVFGKQILNFLYFNTLSGEGLITAVKLLFLGCINLIFLSLVQVSAGILQGLGKHNVAMKSIVVGAVAKVVLTLVLVSMKDINIYGVMISGGVSYFTVFMINYTNIKKYSLARISNVYFNISIQELFVCVFAFLSNYLFRMIFSDTIALFSAGVVAIVIFAVTYYILFMLKDHGKLVST